MKQKKVTDIIIYDDKGNDIEINVSNFLKRTSIDETLKMILYYEYQNHVIKHREKITIENLNCDKDEKIELISKSNYNLGQYIVTDKDTVKPLNYDLFSLIDDKSFNIDSPIWETCKGKDNLEKINIYKGKIKDNKFLDSEYANNGLLEMFYDSILKMNEFTSSEKIENKASAMCSYLVIREMFNRKFQERGLDYKISLPNVFIRGINTEFDALIVKNDKELIYEVKDVYGAIEIKTKGYFADKEQLRDTNEKSNFITYLSKNKDLFKNKPFIYLSMYESFGLREDSVHYYNYLRANISSENLKDFVTGIFCVTKRKKDELLIPYEYDLDEIIDKIVQKIEHKER